MAPSEEGMYPRRLSSIPAAESAPVSRERLTQLSSEIVEIQRALLSAPPDEENIPSTMSTGGWSRMARLLVEMAVHHVVIGDLDAARRAADDALLLVDLTEDPGTHAELSLALSEVLLSVFEAQRARERFEAALVVFERKEDVRAMARARLGLARAMAALRDPVACAVLEDAGTLFEDLGEEELVRAIDRELRELSAELEPSPASLPATFARRTR